MPDTIRTPEKADKLLAALREKPSYAAACRKARISRNAFHHWRRDDLAFAAACRQARDEGLDTGQVHQGPVDALAAHVAAMLDAGLDLDAWVAALGTEEAP